MSVPIEDYALIGDCETAALVSKNGSIDWLCFPRFDSPACFAALLGAEDNGFWSLSPSGENVRVTRRYRNDTLILETEFQTETGTAVLIDFMPLRDGTSDLMRIVEGKSGTVAFDMELNLRFDYGRTVPWVTHGKDGGITAIAGPDRLTLNCAVPLEGRGMSTVGSFQVAAV